MSEKDEELSEKELNALLNDLASRADGQSGGSAPASGAQDVKADEGGEDIEAFLRSLEDEDPSPAPKPAATAERNDELDARFAALDNLQPDDLPARTDTPDASDTPAEPDAQAETDEPKKSRKEKAAEKKAAKARAKEEAKQEKLRAKEEKAKAKQEAAANAPRAKRVAKKVGKWSLMALPMLLFAWIFGAYLGHLISAGWLIAILAILVAVGLPFLVGRLVKRGKVAWWGAGLGLVLTIALIAPMPATAGKTLTQYGHWPAAAVSEVAGWEATNALVRINSIAAEVVGGAINPNDSNLAHATELGTDRALDPPMNPPVAPEAATPALPPPAE
jgi:hypothetical protein